MSYRTPNAQARARESSLSRPGLIQLLRAAQRLRATQRLWAVQRLWAAPLLGADEEQANAMFAVEQRKAEAEVAAIEAATARETAATEAKATRENEESRAKITAMATGAAIAADPNTRTNGEEPVGEILQEALLVSNYSPACLRVKSQKFFSTSFDLQACNGAIWGEEVREKESEREQRRDGAKAKIIGGEKEQEQKFVARGPKTAGQDSLVMAFRCE